MHQPVWHNPRLRAGRFVTRLMALTLVLALSATLFPPLAAAQTDGWRPAMSGVQGIDYRLFFGVPGMDPQDPIHVARLDRSQPNLTIESLIAGGNILVNPDPLNLWTGSGVQPMVDQIDGSLSYWGDLGTGGQAYWGNTSQVIVAVNGDLSNTSTFIPAQGQVQGGWFAWQFDPGENRSGFGWNTARQAFIGNCIYETGSAFGVIPDLSNLAEYWGVEAVNYPRSAERIHIYTPQWGTTADRTWPDAYQYSVEVLVQLSKPLTLGKNFGQYTLDDLNIGRVVDRRISDRDGIEGPATIVPFKMGFDQVVLSGYGTAASRLAGLDIGDPVNLNDGQEIGLNLYLQDGLVGNCPVPSGLSWEGTYTAIGADRTLVANGARVDHDSTPAPRTVIAYNDQYLYFVVAEGHALLRERDDGGYDYLGRTGITFNNLANFMISALDAQWAVNLDGGGSSAMIIGGINRVHTTDLYYCPQHYSSSALCPNCQPQPASARAPLAPAGFDAWDESLAMNQVAAIENLQEGESITIDYSLGSGTGRCQRRIPNGLAMVAVQPMKTSAAFTPAQGDTAFQQKRGLQVRQGPGRNYPLLAYVPYNPEVPSLGVVIQHSNGLDGVYATGSYWWYVEINGQRGWVDQAQITDSISLPASRPAEGP